MRLSARVSGRYRRARGDRGLALVEMAIVSPFLALMLAGILEYGTLWRDSLTATSSSRAAARVVTNLGDDPLADYQALLALHSGLAPIEGHTLEYVMIYLASAVDGQPSATCFDGAGDPVKDSGGFCNVYTGADVATIVGLSCSDDSPCDEFPTDSACAGTDSLTADFCPGIRQTDQNVGLTSVGVWVRISRDYTTGIFPGDGVTMEEYSVMKVEPR